ncbi:MAG: hypothetical protein WAT93_01285, partial [Pontixanthobacter sp.]
MRITVFPALLAALVLAPLPVSAMTYEEAAASGIAPTSPDGMLDCAFYWNTWAKSLNPDHYKIGSGIWDPSWIATLNPAIQLPAAQSTADYWFGRAKAKYKAQKKMAEFDKRMANAPNYDIEALDERKFM